LKKIFLPGLVIYCVLAGWGLFLSSGLSSPFLFPWIAGYLFLVFVVSFHALFSKERLTVFPFIVLGVLQLNFLLQVSGGVHSSLWPVYFLFAVLVAALSSPRRTYAMLGLILVIESCNLFRSGQGDAGKWPVYAGFALSLIGVSIAITYIMHRARREANQFKDAHERLLARASSVDPLAGQSQLAALTTESRQASNVNAAIQSENAFAGLVDMIYEFVPAHTYALFLKENRDEGSVFTLKAKRSDDDGRCTAPLGTVLDPKNDRGPITRCAQDSQPRYLSNMEYTPGNLGYYTRPVFIRSLLAMPIIHQDETVGVLAVDSIEAGAFSLETQDLLSRFTPFFIQIIEKIRVSQELDIRASTFSGLHRLSAVLGSSLDLDDILERLAKEMNVLVPYDFCVFAQYDDRDRSIAIAHQSGTVTFANHGPSLFSRITSAVKLPGSDGAEQDKRFPVEEGTLLNQMLNHWEQGQVAPYHFFDLGERKVTGLLTTTMGLSRQLRSLSCWPLVTAEKFIGAFFLGSLRPNAFSEYHRYFLDTLMNQVAVVMNNVILHQQVQNMALTDGLTGLLNHRTFMDKLDEEFRRLDRAEEQNFSLLLLDIDFFKKVNDDHGHPVGDVALKTIAGVIREVARGIDFVARYGGEEFAVGMVGADSAGAQKTAERIRQAVENTAIKAGRIVIKRTLSIGVASYFPGCSKKETLIARADQALYQAKQAGRNRVCLYHEIRGTEATIARPREKR
jgi:two-component system cell cycle response regulator